MSKKKNKFDLTHLVSEGLLKEGDTLFYVADPKMTCKVARQPSHEYKVVHGAEVLSVHAFAQKCLGQEPPDHASKWLRIESGKTLYDLWHAHEDAEAA